MNKKIPMGLEGHAMELEGNAHELLFKVRGFSGNQSLDEETRESKNLIKVL